MVAAERRRAYANMSDITDHNLTLHDVLELCAPEYNMPELSDRILVLNVMEDGWEATEVDENQIENESIPPLHQTNDTSVSAISSTVYTAEESTGVDKKRSPCLRQRRIHVHSFWLAIQSPYFRSLLFSSGMKENREKEIHLKISKSEEHAHMVLLEALYRDEALNDKSLDELLDVLTLADKYDLKFVFKKCKYVVQENPNTFETSSKIVHVIKVKRNMNDVEDLLEFVQPALVEEFNPLDENWQSEKFTSLSAPCLKQILSSDELIVLSENTVFHALMYWMEENKVHPDTLEDDFLAVVRFKLVTFDYLYNVIRHHSIASNMGNFSDLYRDGLTYHAASSEQKKLLEEKPVVRKKPQEKVIQYIFLVKKKDYETALANGKELNSERFWACGYQINVSINPSSSDHPYLIVHNLKPESYVPLKFAFLANREGHTQWKEKAFSINSCRETYKTRFSQSNFDSEINMLHVAVIPCEGRY